MHGCVLRRGQWVECSLQPWVHSYIGFPTSHLISPHLIRFWAHLCSKKDSPPASWIMWLGKKPSPAASRRNSSLGAWGERQQDGWGTGSFFIARDQFEWRETVAIEKVADVRGRVGKWRFPYTAVCVCVCVCVRARVHTKQLLFQSDSATKRLPAWEAAHSPQRGLWLRSPHQKISLCWAWRAWQPLLQYSCLENPMDRGAWRTTVRGVTQSQTRLKRLSTRREAGSPGPW